MTTVEVMFRKNFFLNDHGEVISYAVLVAEDYTKVWPANNYFYSISITMLFWAFDLFKHPIYFTFILQPTLGKLTLPKWQAVQQFRPWPPYQASDLFFPFSNSTSHHFVVGNQKCQFTQGYCNGPLKPGTRYR